jgi:hypothetical protein
MLVDRIATFNKTQAHVRHDAVVSRTLGRRLLARAAVTISTRPP